eukprot:scaffold1134_cov147-Skeletonema_menzelii.AAC.2
MMRSKLHSLFYFLVLVILFAVANSEPQEANETSITNGDDDEYIDLVDMTDEELEEICTSRGFELVREDGQVYTHKDYVDAATECLQIETDLEEILQKNPQILEDLKQETERMNAERDRLQSQLDEMQTDETISANETQEDHNSAQLESHDLSEEIEEENIVDEEIQYTDENQEDTTETEITSYNHPMYNFKDITMEVIEQMKSDFVKVKNLLIPERLQKQIAPILEKHVVPVLKEFTEQLKPAVKSIVSVAKDMSYSVVDLMKRHAAAFMSKSGGQGEEQSPTSE